MVLVDRDGPNITQMQYLIHKHPELYKEEFEQQYQQYLAQFSIFNLDVSKFNKDLAHAIAFISKIINTFQQHTKEFTDGLKFCLQEKSHILHHEMKLVICKSLMTLRTKKLFTSLELANIFLTTVLPQCPDNKALRKALSDYIVSDVAFHNSKRKDTHLNATMQSFLNRFISLNQTLAPPGTMIGSFKEQNTGNLRIDATAKVISKVALSIMIRLYRKNIWNDEKTVNFIAQACFSKITSIMSMAIHFFLDPNVEQDEEGNAVIKSKGGKEQTAKDIKHSNQVGKKSKSRMRKMKNALKALKKHKSSRKSLDATNLRQKVTTSQLVSLLYDAQEFAEKLFHQLQHRNESFELRMASLDLVSKIIGLEQLQILNFYPYMQRYLQPHQSQVTKLLLYVVQATHELIPPEVIRPTVLTVVNNFITEKNSSHVITVGMNAIRELCNRNPLVMDKDLLNDLEQYSSYKNKNVVMAARSLINLFRRTDPSMLLKKDRGRLGKDWRDIKPVPFGGHRPVKSYIDGIECLTEDPGDQLEDIDEANSQGSRELSPHSERLTNDSELEEFSGDEVEICSSGGEEGVEMSDEAEGGDDDEDTTNTVLDNDKRLEEVSSNRLLTETEMEKIRSYQRRKEEFAKNPEAQRISEKRKRTESKNKDKKGNKNKRQKVDPSNMSMVTGADDNSVADLDLDAFDGSGSDDEQSQGGSGLPSIADIEKLHKLPKMKREERLKARAEFKKQNVEDNRELKRKHGKGRKSQFCSTSNKEKGRKKPFMMTRVKAKKKMLRSMREKQMIVGKTIKNMKRFKKKKR